MKSYDKPRQCIKKQRRYFASSYVRMWELDHKEGWALKNWCFWTVGWRRLLREGEGLKEKTLLLRLQGDQISQFLRKSILIIHWKDWCRNSILWPPAANSWLIGKDPDPGKDWGQGEKRATEDELVEWHHWLNGHESEQTLGDSEGQGSLMCCSPWGRKESDMTDRLNNNKWSSVCLLWKICV